MSTSGYRPRITFNNLTQNAFKRDALQSKKRTVLDP